MDLFKVENTSVSGNPVVLEDCAKAQLRGIDGVRQEYAGDDDRGAVVRIGKITRITLRDDADTKR